MQHTSSTPEQWRDIPGYEGLYQVSDHGRVKSLDRIVHSKTGPRRHRGRIMKFAEGPGGRWQVMLSSTKGERKQKRVHRLVLEAFVGPCPPGMECCHWDDDPKNNHLSNLRWDTRSANKYDSVRNGTHANAVKTHCPNGHKLEEPNLEKWQKKSGYRKCLACQRARGMIQYRPEMRGSFQKVADSYYEKIISGESTIRTHCKRNHPLIEANLIPSARRKGTKSCLACSRARNHVQNREAIKPQIQQISDSYFEEIMKGSCQS